MSFVGGTGFFLPRLPQRGRASVPLSRPNPSQRSYAEDVAPELQGGSTTMGLLHNGAVKVLEKLGDQLFKKLWVQLYEKLRPFSETKKDVSIKETSMSSQLFTSKHSDIAEEAKFQTSFIPISCDHRPPVWLTTTCVIWVPPQFQQWQLATWTSMKSWWITRSLKQGCCKTKSTCSHHLITTQNNMFQKYVVVYFPLFSRAFISDKTSCLKPQPPIFRCLLGHLIAHHWITESQSKMLPIWEADFRLETLIFFHHLTVTSITSG